MWLLFRYSESTLESFRLKGKGEKSGASALLIVLRGLLISLGKPGQEGLRSLADLAGGVAVRVLLAGLGAPRCHDLLADEVVVVVQLENLDHLREDLRVVVTQIAQQTLGATEEGLLVLLAIDDLYPPC
jgi:hypothetical protein